jgi:hypothetical protein
VIQFRDLDVDSPEWLETLRACGASPLLLPAIHLVDSEAESLRLWRMEDEGSVVACALAVERRPRDPKFPLRRKRHLFLPTAPALVDAEDAARVRSALFDHARELGCDRVIVGASASDWLSTDDDLAAHRQGAIVEFVSDLSVGAEAVFAGMHKQHRKNVRRATRDGLRLQEDSSEAGLLELRELQLSSSERASERTEGFGVSDQEFFRRLHEKVYATGFGHVLFAYKGEEVVAALAWIEVGGRVQTVRSGSTPEGYRCRAMYLLYDALIRRACEQGAHELNGGGVPAEAAEADHPQAGLYEFKNGFGGRPILRYGVDVPLKEIR